MISEEIYNALSKLKIETESMKDLNNIMQLSDLAKFAKAIPEPHENSLCMELAIKFVNNTLKY
jgi:predicted CopG family antitoxin